MEDLLTVKQVSVKLGVNGETVRRWLVSGKIKGAKVGGKLWRIREIDLTDFVHGEFDNVKSL
jgi:excisionase family DNA binding protein